VGGSWSTQFSRGEDFATLGQAFLYAGARNVVATLWQIEDNGAAAFAEQFYANLKTMAPDEALATTQRGMLKGSQYSGPYHWAAYQVIGRGEIRAGTHMAGVTSVQRR
jgi:CHAT domain-containing protein